MSIDTTKSVYLIKLFEVLRQQGVPVAPIVRAAGLTAVELADREVPLPIGKYLQAVEEIVRTIDIPDLGFQVGARTMPMEHGVLGYALLSSPTLRDCLKRYVRYQFLQGPLLVVSIEESGTTASMTASPRGGNYAISSRALRYIVQEWLVGWNQWCRIIGRAGSFFEHVQLGYSPEGEAHYYETHLGCTVSFGNPATTAIFPARRLDLPLDYADKSIAALCTAQCQRLLEVLNLRPGIATEIHRQLASLPGQAPSMEDMARRLRLGSRTLRRRLHDEGTTYQNVRMDFRVAMAQRYLEETTLPANEVAALVGYADPANLYRVFHKATGTTPNEYRQACTQTPHSG